MSAICDTYGGEWFTESFYYRVCRGYKAFFAKPGRPPAPVIPSDHILTAEELDLPNAPGGRFRGRLRLAEIEEARQKKCA